MRKRVAERSFFFFFSTSTELSNDVRWEGMGILGLWRKNYLWNSRWHQIVIHTSSVSPCYVLVPVLSQAPSPATLTVVILVTLVPWWLPGVCWVILCQVRGHFGWRLRDPHSVLKGCPFPLIDSWKGESVALESRRLFSGRDDRWAPEVYVAYVFLNLKEWICVIQIK